MSPTFFEISPLYLTPRVVKTAQAAGVIAFGSNTDHLVGIYLLVQEAYPEIAPREPLDGVAFVARWSGRVASFDVRYGGAKPGQPYLPAEQYATSVPDGQDGWLPKAKVQETNKLLVEIDLAN